MSLPRFDWTALSDQLAVNELIRTLNIRMPRVARAIPQGPYVDLREAGASINGVSDDTSAWAKTIAKANANNAAVWFPGGTSLAQVVFPANQQTRVYGPGPGKAVILGSVSASHSHQTTEWDSALCGVTVNGNASTTRAASLRRVSKFLLFNVRLTNVQAAGLALLASWDGTLFDVFFSGSDGVVGSASDAPFVVDGDVTASEECVQNRGFGIHLEPGAVDNVYWDVIGGASSKTRYNKWWFSKLDGVPATSAPAHPLLRVRANSSDTSWHGGDCAYGTGSSQIEVSGDRNLLADFEHLTGATAPTHAIQFLAGNDNQVRGFRTQNSNWTGSLFDVGAGCSRTKFRHNNWPQALASVITDAGFQTDFEQPNVRVGVIVATGASSTPNPTLGTGHDISASGATQSVAAPSNPVDGMQLDISILNNTVGALTTTFDGIFKLVGGAWTDPGPGKRRTLSTRYFGYLPGWVEFARASGDI